MTPMKMPAESAATRGLRNARAGSSSRTRETPHRAQARGPAIGVAPVAFSAAQLRVPWLLEKSDGNLRRVTLAILAYAFLTVLTAAERAAKPPPNQAGSGCCT